MICSDTTGTKQCELSFNLTPSNLNTGIIQALFSLINSLKPPSAVGLLRKITRFLTSACFFFFCRTDGENFESQLKPAAGWREPGRQSTPFSTLSCFIEGGVFRATVDCFLTFSGGKLAAVGLLRATFCLLNKFLCLNVQSCMLLEVLAGPPFFVGFEFFSFFQITAYTTGDRCW